MKKQKLFALALAGVTTLSTLAAGTPVMASGLSSGTQEAESGHSSNTTVSLTVEEKNNYELIVPAETNLNTDGSATELTNGLTVYGRNLTKNVIVTAETKELTSETTNTSISYKLYANADAAEATNKWEFSAEKINNDSHNSENQPVFVKADAESLKAAAPGQYSGVITFSASLEGESSGGGEVAPSEKEYREVTEENISELLKADSQSNKNIEYTSMENAKQWADKYTEENEIGTIVIYGFDSDSKKFKVYVSPYSEEGAFTTFTYNEVNMEVENIVYYIYVYK